MKQFLDIEVSFPKSEIDFFFENVKTVNLKKGEYFHKADKTCNKIGIVKSGLLKSFVNDEKENTKIDLAIRTSRVFIKEKGDWKQIQHHGSIDNPDLLKKYQEAIMNK